MLFESRAPLMCTTYRASLLRDSLLGSGDQVLHETYGIPLYHLVATALGGIGQHTTPITCRNAAKLRTASARLVLPSVTFLKKKKCSGRQLT